MRVGAGLLLSCVFLLGSSHPSLTAAEKARWETGRLVAAELSGHGVDPRGKQPGKQSDVWWVYCISADGKAFSVVSRENPPKAGLTIDCPVRFIEERDRLQLLNPLGKRLVMRIVRRGGEDICR